MEGYKQCPRCECTDVPLGALQCPFCGFEFEKPPVRKAEVKQAAPPPAPVPARPQTVDASDAQPQTVPVKQEPPVQTGTATTTASTGQTGTSGTGGGNYKAYQKKKKKHSFLKFALLVVIIAYVWVKFIQPSMKEDEDSQSSEAADIYSTSPEDADPDGQMADGGAESTSVLSSYAVAQATVLSSGAKIRQEADTNSEMVGGAEEGQVLNVFSEVVGADGFKWYQVQVNDTTTGYVRSDLVEIIGDIGGDTEGSTEGEGEAEFPMEAPAQYVLPLSDQVYLTRADIAGLSAEELRIARNEIYARHGRLFRDEALQAYFDSCDWYEGTISADDFSDSVFNEYEKANKDLIVSYEHELGVNGQ